MLLKKKMTHVLKVFYFSTQEKHTHKLTAMHTVNCISSQLLNDGYKMSDTILNITANRWLQIEEGIKENCYMPVLFKGYILLYSSTCSFGRLCVIFQEIQFLNSDIYLKGCYTICSWKITISALRNISHFQICPIFLY